MVDGFAGPRIWKHSHGPNSFTRDELESYLRDQVIVIYAGYEQGRTFYKDILIKDWFYLCHGNKGKDTGIQLFGTVASGAESFIRRGRRWWKRKYDLKTWRITRSGYLKDKRAWTPGGNSTCRLVPEKELPDFQKKILRPFFNLRVQDLLDKTNLFPERTSNKLPSFSPEFSGHKSYATRGQIESDSVHGIVMSALAANLRKLHVSFANDRPRDLYVFSPNLRMSALFEAKTETSTTSIYQGIGQLMFNGAAESPPPKRVLVLPNAPNSRTRAALMRLGISVLYYRWKRNVPTFEGIHELFR